MDITKWRPAYAIAFVAGMAIIAYLAVRFIGQREQTAIDSRIVADIHPVIEARLRSLAASDALLAQCGKFKSWRLENWGRFSRPIQPRLFINGTVHFEKADFGCIVNVVHGPLSLSLHRLPDDKSLNEYPKTFKIVERRLEVTDDFSKRQPTSPPPAEAMSGTAQPVYSISYGRFDGEATHPDFVPD